MHLLLPLAYLNLDDHSQKVIQGGQDIPAVSTWGADSEISLKKALFELRETLARAECRWSVCWLLCIPIQLGGLPAIHPSICSFLEQMFTQYLVCLDEHSEQDRLRPRPLGTWWERQAGSQTRLWDFFESYRGMWESETSPVVFTTISLALRTAPGI